MQGLLAEGSWGTSVFCINVGLTCIIKQEAMFLNSHCNKNILLKFAYEKYLACFTLQCLKLILKEENK